MQTGRIRHLVSRFPPGIDFGGQRKPVRRFFAQGSQAPEQILVGQPFVAIVSDVVGTNGKAEQ